MMADPTRIAVHVQRKIMAERKYFNKLEKEIVAQLKSEQRDNVTGIVEWLNGRVQFKFTKIVNSFLLLIANKPFSPRRACLERLQEIREASIKYTIYMKEVRDNVSIYNQMTDGAEAFVYFVLIQLAI